MKAKTLFRVRNVFGFNVNYFHLKSKKLQKENYLLLKASVDDYSGLANVFHAVFLN